MADHTPQPDALSTLVPTFLLTALAARQQELIDRWEPVVLELAAERGLPLPRFDASARLILAAHLSMCLLYSSALTPPDLPVLYRHIEQFLIDGVEAAKVPDPAGTTSCQ